MLDPNNGHFDIDQFGQIFVNASLDYETQSKYFLYIECQEIYTPEKFKAQIQVCNHF